MEKVTLEEDFLKALKHYYLSPESQTLEHFLESETAFSIFDCFINLAIVVYEHQKQQEEQQLTTAKGLFRDDKVSCYESIYEPQKVIAIADIFSEIEGQKPQNHILVSGRAGIGKTTFCQYMATHWAAAHFDSLGDWIKDFTGVIWIPLRKLKELNTRMSLGAFIHGHSLMPEDQLKIAIGQVERELNNANYRWLFLLDGADEVLEEIKNPHHPAYYLFTELKAKSDWMLTTRPHQLEPRSLGEFRHLELTGFTWPNIVQYVETFFETIGKAALAENLLRTIMLNPNLRGIAHVPMQLELLCSIWQDSKGELNVEDMTFTELYQKLIVGLLRRYLNKQGVDTSALMDDEILTHTLVKPLVTGLQQIAWHMFEANTLIFEVKKNQRLMKTIEKNQRDLLFNQVHLLKVTGDQKSQLIDKKYYFVHLTFQEFFVAWYIVDAIQTHKFSNPYGNLSQLLTKTLFNPRYEIVCWFVAGLLKAYAPEEVENFFKLTGQLHPYDLSSYLTLQMIRFQEEANFYVIEPGKLSTDNLTTFNIEHVILNIGNKSNSEAIRLAYYLNASPNFCRMLAIEDKLLKTLDNFWTTKQPTHLLFLVLNSWALKDLSLNYLQTLLQNHPHEKNWEVILQLLLSIISHYPELALNLNQEPLLKLLNHRNYFLVQWLIKLAAFFTEVNERLVDFLIDAIKNQRDMEVIIRPTLDTLLTFAYADKLTPGQKLKLRKVIFSCIADESGWLLRELAELLVTITDSEESYSVFLKNLFNKSLPTRFSVKSRPDYQSNNQLSFTMTPYLIARVLTALVKTNDQLIIDALLRMLKKELIKKGQKNFKIIENILCAFLNANYCADDVLSWAFLIIETPKIPIVYKKMALEIISHIPTLSIYICKKLEKLYQGQNVLLSLTCFMMLVKHKQVVVTDAQMVQKLITYLFYAQQTESNLTDLTKQVRSEALHALFSFNLSHPNTLQLLESLELSDFILDGYSTFKGTLIKLLSKYINEHVHILFKLEELANDAQAQDHYVYLVGAFSCLSELPNSLANKLLEWLSLSNVDKQECAALILAVAFACKKFIKTGNYLHQLINAKFKTAQESEWLFLAEFLASVGELRIEDLKTLTQSYLNLMGENILTIFGYSGAAQQKVLIEFLLPLLQAYEVQSSEAWSLYRILKNFDLTHYLSQIANHSANSFWVEGTPTKSLINNYISQHNDDFLKLFYQRIVAQGLIVYYHQSGLVWYEQNERIEVQISEALLAQIKQQFTGVLASHANRFNDNTPNADLFFNKQQDNKNTVDYDLHKHNSILDLTNLQVNKIDKKCNNSNTASIGKNMMMEYQLLAKRLSLALDHALNTLAEYISQEATRTQLKVVLERYKQQLTQFEKMLHDTSNPVIAKLIPTQRTTLENTAESLFVNLDLSNSAEFEKHLIDIIGGEIKAIFKMPATLSSEELRHEAKALLFESTLEGLGSTLQQQAIQGPSCFISYAWGNSAIARKVHKMAQQLVSVGINVVLDIWHNRTNSIVQFTQRVYKEDFVLVMGSSLLKQKYEEPGQYGSYVHEELEHIGIRIKERQDKQLYPSGSGVLKVLVENPHWSAFPDFLKPYPFDETDFTNEHHYYDKFFNLLNLLYVKTLKGKEILNHTKTQFDQESEGLKEFKEEELKRYLIQDETHEQKAEQLKSIRDKLEKVSAKTKRVSVNVSYQTQPTPGVHYFQSSNTNQPQINNKNNTDTWTNYAASNTNTQDCQNPTPK